MSTEDALRAMDAAERVARNAITAEMPFTRWARDRLRLIARDRATLERHAPDDEFPMWCGDGGCGELASDWPCPDAQAVIDYWQEDA